MEQFRIFNRNQQEQRRKTVAIYELDLTKNRMTCSRVTSVKKKEKKGSAAEPTIPEAQRQH